MLVFLPWLVLFEAVELLGVPPDAVSEWQRWERSLPVIPWTEVVYALTYPFVSSRRWSHARAVTCARS